MHPNPLKSEHERVQIAFKSNRRIAASDNGLALREEVFSDPRQGRFIL